MSNTFPILTKLGGPEAVAEQLLTRGFFTTKKAVEMWIARGHISGTGQIALMQMAEAKGVTFCSRDFLPASRKESAEHSPEARTEAA